MHPVLSHTDHRPWPLPGKPWLWRQSWQDLAFIHHRVDAAALRPLLPPELTLQEFDGSAWVGVVPFRMGEMMLRTLPAPWLLRGFPELNVRTYVEFGGKPGVWFFSLDTTCRPLIAGARVLYGLPYFRAGMRMRRDGDWIAFESTRHGGAPGFRGRYRPVGEAAAAVPGTFEHWSAERYCLYSQRPGGGLVRLEIHHPPWPLQRAEAVADCGAALAAAGITPLDEAPICGFSSGVEVVSFTAERIDRRCKTEKPPTYPEPSTSP
jgi:uncharacterized protein YqjF (DUF2071 family)